MRTITTSAMIITALTSNYTFGSTWLYFPSTDEFSGKKIHKATIMESINTNIFAEFITASDFEMHKIGLNCETTRYGDTARWLDFDFDIPFAYYNAPIEINIKVGEYSKTFAGQMYKNTMQSGYSRLSLNDFKELMDVLAKGNSVDYRIDRVGNGESKGTRLTLKGSKKALDKLSPHCNI